MRIKNFTLMLMAVLFSAVGFAQKSFPVGKDIAFKRQTTVQTLTKQNTIGSALAVKANGTTTQGTVAGRAKARAKAPDLVTPPERGDVEYYTLSGTNSKDGAATRQVKVVWDDEDEDVLYVSGLSYYMPSSYVKGTFTSDDKVVFAAGQYVGNPGVDLYFGGYGDGTALADVEATFNEKEGTFTFLDYLLDNGDPTTLGYFAYWQAGVVLTPLDGDPEIPVEIPSDLEYEKYAYSAYDYFDEVDVSGNVNIGIYGEDVYIQGMSTDYPNAWIKGTFENDTTVVFAGLTDASSSDENQGAINRSTLVYEPDVTYHLQELLKINESPVAGEASTAAVRRAKLLGGEYDIWLIITAHETVTTESSTSQLNDYYNMLAYQNYYNSMYGGYGGYGYGYGYGSYGYGYNSYSNYYSMMMLASLYGSTGTSTSTTDMLDKDRYYSGTLYGPLWEDASLRPRLELTFSLANSE